MTTPFFVALVALFGTIWVAIFQAWWSRSSDRQQRVREQKREVFSELLNGLSGLHAANPADPNWIKARTEIVKARCKIALFASPKAVEAVGNLFNFANLSKGPGQEAMIDAIRKMRSDLGLVTMPTDEAIRLIVFGVEEVG